VSNQFTAVPVPTTASSSAAAVAARVGDTQNVGRRYDGGEGPFEFAQFEEEYGNEAQAYWDAALREDVARLGIPASEADFSGQYM
jgi:hypothetical protein